MNRIRGAATMSFLEAQMATLRQRPVSLAFLIGTGIVLLGACGGGPTPPSAEELPSTPGVSYITLDPSKADIAVGATVQLTATPRDAAGNVLTGLEVKWSSDSPGVASVSQTGVVTGTSVCLATITASTGGQRASASITVSAASGSAAASGGGARNCG